MQVRQVLTSAVAALLLVGGFASAAHAADGAPPNDNKANAAAVTAIPTDVQVDTTNATNEPTEPDDCGTSVGHTVWYRVTVPTDTKVVLSTDGSNFDTVLSVYEENSGSEFWIGCNDDSGANSIGTSQMSFNAYSGSSYLVQVGGFNGASGDLHVDFGTVKPLGNDNFANAYELTGSYFNIDASNAGATKESGEPIPCNRYLTEKTVWFKWTAPGHGLLGVYADNRVIGVYRGQTLSQLEPVGCDNGPYSSGPIVDGGETYYIQVGVNDLGAADAFSLSGSFVERAPAAANDELSAAEKISALGETHTADNAAATVANGEPLCQYMDQTIWYSYTATQDGPLVASTEGSQVETAVAVYTGSQYSDLAQVACSGNNSPDYSSRAGFNATAGQTYLIQVGAYYCCSAGGSVSVAIYSGQSVSDPVLGAATATATTKDGQVHEASAGAGGVGAGARTSDDPSGKRATVCVAGVCDTEALP